MTVLRALGGVGLDVEAFGVDNVKATIQDGHMASAIMNAAIQDTACWFDPGGKSELGTLR